MCALLLLKYLCYDDTLHVMIAYKIDKQQTDLIVCANDSCWNMNQPSCTLAMF